MLLKISCQYCVIILYYTLRPKKVISPLEVFVVEMLNAALNVSSYTIKNTLDTLPCILNVFHCFTYEFFVIELVIANAFRNCYHKSNWQY